MATSVMTMASQPQIAPAGPAPAQPRQVQAAGRYFGPRTGRRYRQQNVAAATVAAALPQRGLPARQTMQTPSAIASPPTLPSLQTPGYPDTALAVAEANDYRRVERPKAVTPDDEIRVTASGRPTRYVSYASKLFQEQKKNAVTLRATGAAVSVAVAVCEVVKRRFRGLHQVTQIGWTEVVDEWEPLKADLEPISRQRSLPSISILLTFDETAVDKNLPGYQAPLADYPSEDQIIESPVKVAASPPRRNFRNRRRPAQLNGLLPPSTTAALPQRTVAGARIVAPAVLPRSGEQAANHQRRPRMSRTRRMNRGGARAAPPASVAQPIAQPSVAEEPQQGLLSAERAMS